MVSCPRVYNPRRVIEHKCVTCQLGWIWCVRHFLNLCHNWLSVEHVHELWILLWKSCFHRLVALHSYCIGFQIGLICLFFILFPCVVFEFWWVAMNLPTFVYEMTLYLAMITVGWLSFVWVLGSKIIVFPLFSPVWHSTSRFLNLLISTNALVDLFWTRMLYT